MAAPPASEAERGSAATSRTSTAARAKAAVRLSEAVAGPDQLVARAVSLEEIRLVIDVTNKELSAATARSDQLSTEATLAATATDELAQQTDDLGGQTLEVALNNYEHSEVPRGLLAIDDLTNSMRASTLGEVAIGSDVKRFEAYRNLRKDLEIEQSELAVKVERAADARAQVDELTTQLQSQLSILGDLQERRLGDQAAVVSIRAGVRGQYEGHKQGFYLDTCPVDGPHTFIDSWGFARSGGRRHEGVDIMASIGTKVVAPTDGVVEHFNNSVGGRSFRETTADGNYFYGTHMSGFAKSGKVKAGEVIGYTGDDGNAAGIPHLHFEIHPGGQSRPAINPFIDAAAVCSGVKY